jgi:hypothetical protein
MNPKKVVAIVAAVFASLGQFLPLASSGQLYVNLSHLSGLCFALYATLPALLILTILRQYKAFAGWTIGVAVATLLFAVYARLVAVATVQQFASMSQGFGNFFGGGAASAASQAPPAAATGSGFIIIVAGALICAVATLTSSIEKN